MADLGRKEEEPGSHLRAGITSFRRSSRNRESHDEIAALESKLRRAYIAKELHVQLVEKETERYVEKMRGQQALKLLRQEEQTSIQTDLHERSESIRKTKKYRQQLTDQIARKQEERGARMEEDRREREVLTKVDRIREQSEKRAEQRIKRDLAESTSRERFILAKMKQLRDEEKMELEAKKLSKDRGYLKELDQRIEKSRQLRVEQIESRERVMSKIAEILTSAIAEKEKRMALVGKIMAEDVERELWIREEKEIVRRVKMRGDLAADLEGQIVFMEQCKIRFVEQDKAFAEEIMRRVMEDEKTAKLTAQASRRMQAQYRQDLVWMMEERRRIREIGIAEVEEEARKEYESKMAELRHVELEKKRLLEKHAMNVVGFLDESTLSREEKGIMAKAIEEKSAQ